MNHSSDDFDKLLAGYSTPHVLTPGGSRTPLVEDEEEIVTPAYWKGYVVVGDNIDKTVHARHQTLSSRNRSLHYFNNYAVLDRCDFSHLPEYHILPDLLSYDVTEILPSETD